MFHRVWVNIIIVATLTMISARGAGLEMVDMDIVRRINVTIQVARLHQYQ